MAECSMSMASQSKPAVAMISAIEGWPMVIHEPMVSSRLFNLSFNCFTRPPFPVQRAVADPESARVTRCLNR